MVDPAEVQPAADGVQGGGVVGDDLDERGADGCAAAQPQHHGWCLGAGRVGQLACRVRAAGVEQAAVHVEHGHLVAGQRRGRRLLGQPAAVGGHQLDDREVHRLLVELQQQRQRDADADRGGDRQEQGRAEGA